LALVILSCDVAILVELYILEMDEVKIKEINRVKDIMLG